MPIHYQIDDRATKGSTCLIDFWNPDGNMLYTPLYRKDTRDLIFIRNTQVHHLRYLKRNIVLPMLSMVDLAMLVSSFAVTITPVFAQDTPYSEEYMQQHGDRAEYLQEMESSDPPFYVPLAN